MTRKRFVIGLMVLVFSPIFTIAVLGFSGNFEVKDLPVFGEVPHFELTERAGDKVTRQDFSGKVWVASFVFTRCSGQCPMLCAEVAKIQNKLRFKDNFRLLSISVDPTNDTPEALKAYADRFAADPYKWLFATGDKREIQSLIQHGFRLASVEEGAEIIHSFKLVLVDAYGRIRGYYDGLDSAAVKQLIKDAKRLIRQR